jgi:hypothetical protein
VIAAGDHHPCAFVQETLAIARPRPVVPPDQRTLPSSKPMTAQLKASWQDLARMHRPHRGARVAPGKVAPVPAS